MKWWPSLFLREQSPHFIANSSHEEQTIMEERVGEAFAGSEHFTVIGRQLQVGDPAPDFCLDFLDLADLIVRTISLADSTGMVRLLSVVNSLQRPVCRLVTHQWEAYRATLPSEACIYTVSRDSPQMQAKFQDTTGVLHQALSAHRCEQFGADYGVWLKEWRLLQRSVFVINCHDRIIYVEYVADQLREPDYAAAMQAVLQAVGVRGIGSNETEK
jgi:thioredoxin-dependent peroxiredoxin